MRIVNLRSLSNYLLIRSCLVSGQMVWDQSRPDKAGVKIVDGAAALRLRQVFGTGRIRKRPTKVVNGLPLPAGLYQVRVGVRDLKSGRIGSAMRWITIPNLSVH